MTKRWVYRVPMRIRNFGTSVKSAFFIIFFVSYAGATSAQGFLGGFFNQKQTQIKDYLQQIAAYQAYLTYLKKGYAIVRNGTGNICNLKNADLLLQTAEVDSLKMVNPRIRNYPKVSAIIRMEQQMAVSRSQASGQFSGSGQFTRQELSALHETIDSYASDGKRDLDELQLLTTDNQLSMSDDERIAGIDRLYDKVFAASNRQKQIVAAAFALMAQRQQEGKDAGTLQMLLPQ